MSTATPRRWSAYPRSTEPVERFLELAQFWGLALVYPLPLDVARRRASTEVDRGLVPLRETDESGLQARRRAGQEQEQAGRERVERPGVARPGPRAPAGRSDDREGGRPGGLVDEDDAARCECAGRHCYRP